MLLRMVESNVIGRSNSYRHDSRARRRQDDQHIPTIPLVSSAEQDRLGDSPSPRQQRLLTAQSPASNASECATRRRNGRTGMPKLLPEIARETGFREVCRRPDRLTLHAKRGSLHREIDEEA